MSKREDYKRFIIFLLASLIVLAQMAIFAYVWYNIYRGQINKPFWRKGNWVLIAIYGLLFGLFSKLYGGLKVGYLKRSDVFYSLTLALLCTNVVEYLQITLINRWFLEAWPMIEMTGIQLIVSIVWIWGSRYIYSRLYRARKLLVIYGDRDPGDDLIHKMNSRRDKYDISGKVHASVGEEEIHRMMADYDGVIIESFGVGGLPNYGDDSFYNAIERWMKAGKFLVMATQVTHEGSDMSVYQVGKELKEHFPVFESYDMTLEATVTKMMWALAQTKEREAFEKLFYQTINHDILFI